MKCSSKQCKTTMPGIWAPTILLWSGEIRNHEPASVQLREVFICDLCKNTLKPWHLMPEKSWKEITMAFLSLGKKLPSLKSATIVYTVPDSLDLGGLTV